MHYNTQLSRCNRSPYSNTGLGGLQSAQQYRSMGTAVCIAIAYHTGTGLVQIRSSDIGIANVMPFAQGSTSTSLSRLISLPYLFTGVWIQFQCCVTFSLFFRIRLKVQGKVKNLRVMVGFFIQQINKQAANFSSFSNFRTTGWRKLPPQQHCAYLKPDQRTTHMTAQVNCIRRLSVRVRTLVL